MGADASSNESANRTKYGLLRALQLAEERFDVLFREASDPVLTLSPDGLLAAANEAWTRYAGAQPDTDWMSFIHPEDTERLRACLLDCAAAGGAQLLEVRLLSGDGFYQWFECSISPLHDETRQVCGLLVVARNIHRRKELESQLREKAESIRQRHQRAQLLVSKLKHFLSSATALSGGIEDYLNGICQVLNGMYRPRAVCLEVEGEDTMSYAAGTPAPACPIVVPSSIRAQLLRSGLPLYSNALHVTDPYREDPEVRSRGWITCLGAPLRDANGQLRGSLILLDTKKHYYDHVDVELITIAALHGAARCRAEEQEKARRELEENLRHAQKMEAVGMLAGGIAHDFNNILSGILGFSSHLLSKTDPETGLHRDLSLIEQSAVRATELTRQLLAFSRRRHFNKESISFNILIQEVVRLLRRTMRQEVAIETALTPELPAVLGDEGQLNQVLMNLCLNAVEALRGKADGVLRIQTETRLLTPHEQLMLDAAADRPFVCIRLSDNGVGIPEDVREHIFEPFFTTKSGQGGTGLGLSIVYGIVINHGGHVTVDSRMGEGTTFTLYFPVHEGPIAPSEAVCSGRLSGDETLLVVDDEAVVRRMACEVLQSAGYRVLSAFSGPDALRCLDENRGHVDLVLLDMIMPGMDGEAAFKALRMIDPDLAVLLTSGFVQEDKCARLLEAGALGMLSKPYKSDVLLQHVRTALNRKTG